MQKTVYITFYLKFKCQIRQKFAKKIIENIPTKKRITSLTFTPVVSKLKGQIKKYELSFIFIFASKS